MEFSDHKYFIDETISKKDNDKWLKILEFAFERADGVEFNILKSDNELQKILAKFQDDFIEKNRRKNKIYANGKFIRFKLSDRLKEFVKSKKISTWKNYCLEDISLLNGSTEILATITHENYIYLLLTELEAEDFNNQGFNFNHASNLVIEK
jgi:hypothetical protein